MKSVISDNHAARHLQWFSSLRMGNLKIRIPFDRLQEPQPKTAQLRPGDSPFGQGLRVTSRGSKVNGRGSKNYSKLFYSYLLTSLIQKFTGSCLLEFSVPVFAAFGSYFCLSKTFTFPQTLRRAEHQNLALSIFTVKLFFSLPRIRIIVQDNAIAEDAVTYHCKTQVLKQYCLFRAETQWVLFCSTIHLLIVTMHVACSGLLKSRQAGVRSLNVL